MKKFLTMLLLFGLFTSSSVVSGSHVHFGRLAFLKHQSPSYHQSR
ncbi:hypothetical protein AB1L30_12205 [Bremerella sp. JC817]